MEDENNVVTPEPTPGTGETPAPEPAEPAGEPQVQKPPKGFVPYQALEEERKKSKEAEEQLKNLTPAPSEPEPEDDVFSEEGKALKGDIKALNEKLRSLEKREARKEVEIEFPILKERKEEFETFLEDEENSRISIRKAAQLFLAEQNLLVEKPKRKGLEKPTGGGQVIPEPKLTAEEIDDMMKNDWRRYEKLLREGKIV